MLARSFRRVARTGISAGSPPKGFFWALLLNIAPALMLLRLPMDLLLRLVLLPVLFLLPLIPVLPLRGLLVLQLTLVRIPVLPLRGLRRELTY